MPTSAAATRRAAAIPLIVWISRDGVGVDYYSRCWFEYTGLGGAGPGDLDWQAALYPEDEPLLARMSAAARSSGEAFEFGVQGRLRRHDGVYPLAPRPRRAAPRRGGPSPPVGRHRHRH